MPHPLLYPTSGRYVVTPEGHRALNETPTCTCTRVVWRGMIVCQECDTVYGILRQQSFLGVDDRK